MSIAVESVTKTFGKFTALRDIDIEISAGELVALLGPSGCGKTTLLRIIAGLEAPDPGRGRIVFKDCDGKEDGPKRRVGFVFQHYALFRHMTVFENVAFGLRVLPRSSRPSRAAIERRVEDLLRLVQLEGFSGRYPANLSGGQRQRVALARALAVQPRVLLLDEPFGALDARVRQELRKWLRSLHDRIGLTSLFVTHDQEEAMELADRVAIMNAGRIEQVGTPDEVFHHPASQFVMNFLGNVNIFRGRVEGGKAHFGSVAIDVPGKDAGSGTASVFVRPHDFEVDTRANGRAAFKGRVERVNSAGVHVKLQVLGESGDRVDVEIPRERFQALGIAAGSDVYLIPREIKVFLGDYAI